MTLHRLRHSRIAIFRPAAVLVCALALAGCSGGDVPVVDGDGAAVAREPEAPAGANAKKPPIPADDAVPPTGAGGETGNGASNPLIRGFRDLLGASPLIEDDDELQQGLFQADSILSQVKEENRRALRDLNRQIPGSPQRSPNILIVVADRLGYGDLGAYGQAWFETPHLDALAAAGMRFTQFYAGGVSAAASQWCLMTGCDTARTRQANRTSYTLASERITLGEVLWQAGYETVFVGPWWLTENARKDMPHLHGFDRWLGSLGDEAAVPFPATLWSDGAEIRLRANAGGQKTVLAQDFYTDEIVAYLEKGPRERPFLLVASYPLPGLTDGLIIEVDEHSDWSEREQTHAATVGKLDRDLGRIFQTLKVRGLDRHTVVLVTSSNGPPAIDALSQDRLVSTGGLKGRAGELYEGGLRVPLIVRWPSRVAAGAVCDAPAALWDLLPTCADIAGANRRPAPLDGISLLPVLRGGKDLARKDMLYWEMHAPGFGQAVRRDGWKVVRPPGKMQLQEVELYDLTHDPGESRNVAQENPEVVSQFIRGQ